MMGRSDGGPNKIRGGGLVSFKPNNQCGKVGACVDCLPGRRWPPSTTHAWHMSKATWPNLQGQGIFLATWLPMYVAYGVAVLGLSCGGRDVEMLTYGRGELRVEWRGSTRLLRAHRRIWCGGKNHTRYFDRRRDSSDLAERNRRRLLHTTFRMEYPG